MSKFEPTNLHVLVVHNLHMKKQEQVNVLSYDLVGYLKKNYMIFEDNFLTFGTISR